jgi:hypothetical protein
MQLRVIRAFISRVNANYLILLRYDEYLDRLLESDAEEKGITFQEFLVFCTFLNNLEDFAVAMRMYSLADRPISEGTPHPHVKRNVPDLLSTDFDLFGRR